MARAGKQDETIPTNRGDWKFDRTSKANTEEQKTGVDQTCEGQQRGSLKNFFLDYLMNYYY